VNLGSYKPVNGVMFPFSTSNGPKGVRQSAGNTTYDKIEVNVPLDEGKLPCLPH